MALTLEIGDMRTSVVTQCGRIHLPCRSHGFNPWSGKTPHAVEQLSLCATTIEPVLQSSYAATTEPRALEPELHNKRGHYNEKATHHN